MDHDLFDGASAGLLERLLRAAASSPGASVDPAASRLIGSILERLAAKGADETIESFLEPYGISALAASRWAHLDGRPNVSDAVAPAVAIRDAAAAGSWRRTDLRSPGSPSDVPPVLRFEADAPPLFFFPDSMPGAVVHAAEAAAVEQRSAGPEPLGEESLTERLVEVDIDVEDLAERLAARIGQRVAAAAAASVAREIAGLPDRSVSSSAVRDAVAEAIEAGYPRSPEPVELAGRDELADQLANRVVADLSARLEQLMPADGVRAAVRAEIGPMAQGSVSGDDLRAWLEELQIPATDDLASEVSARVVHELAGVMGRLSGEIVRTAQMPAHELTIFMQRFESQLALINEQARSDRQFIESLVDEVTAASRRSREQVEAVTSQFTRVVDRANRRIVDDLEHQIANRLRLQPLPEPAGGLAAEAGVETPPSQSNGAPRKRTPRAKRQQQE